MKKLLTIALAFILALSLTVNVFAAEEVEIPLVAESFGVNSQTASDTVTWGDNSVSANAISLFSLTLPTPVNEGETVVVHIKGTSDGDFRVWLLGAAQGTASNQYKMSDNGFVSGEFEKYIELTFTDHDSKGITVAEDVCFKAPSWDAQLTNLNLTYVGVFAGSLADMDAAALAEVQPSIDAAEEAIANGDVDAALAAIEVVSAKGDLGFASCTAKANELLEKVDGIYDDALLASLQEYVDKVTAALETAKNANGDIAVMSAAYEEAVAAADYVTEQGKGYEKVTEKAKELKVIAKEIKDMIAEAEEAQAQAEAEEAERVAAQEAAAAKTRTVLIIVLAVVALAVVVVAVCVVIAKNKKK